MVSNARLDFPDPDSPVITTRASRGIAREMSLRLCSRAPETRIWLPAGMSAHSRTANRRSPRRWSFDGGVYLLHKAGPVGQLEVLGQIALGRLARLPVERHVESDQPGSIHVDGARRTPWSLCGRTLRARPRGGCQRGGTGARARGTRGRGGSARVDLAVGRLGGMAAGVGGSSSSGL